MLQDYYKECELCKIFSSPNRMKILTALKNKELTVSEIIKITKLPQSVVSQHLSMAESRGILSKEKEGSFVRYKIKYPKIMDAFSIMEDLRKRIKK